MSQVAETYLWSTLNIVTERMFKLSMPYVCFWLLNHTIDVTLYILMTYPKFGVGLFSI